MAPPQQLKNIVRFTALAPGVPTSLPHGLNVAGRGVIPDVITATPLEGFAITANATNVTVQRLGDGDAVDCLCEHWHSYERSFGGSGTTNLTPRPFVVGGGATTPAFASAVFTIYARTTGNDTTGNGSLAAPYRTFQRAIRDVPLIIPPGARYIVDISGLGTETLPPDFAVPPWKAGFALCFVDVGVFSTQAAVSIIAQPQLLASIPAADAVINPGDIASLTADPDTRLYTLTLNAPRASWAADALKGAFFIGADTDSQAVIAASTNTTIALTISDQNTGFVPAGPFQIMEPSTTLEGSRTPGFRGAFNVLNVDSILLGGIRFVNTGGANLPGLGIRGTQQPVLYFCDFARTNFDMGEFEIDVTRCYIHGGPITTQGAITFERCFLDAVVSGDALPQVPQTFFFNTTESIWDGCFAIGNQKGPIGPAVAGFGTGGLPCTIFASFTEIRNAPANGVYYTGGGGLIQWTRIANCGANGILGEKAGGTLGLSEVVGTGNAGYGVLLDDGTHVQVDAGTTITGTLGDRKVGANAAAAWPGVAFSDTDAVTLSRAWQA